MKANSFFSVRVEEIKKNLSILKWFIYISKIHWHEVHKKCRVYS